MDRVELREKAVGIFKKYKYAALVVLLGLCLMLLPSKSAQTEQEQTAPTAPSVQEQSAEQMLAEILSKVKGAGEVQVLLTTAQGEQTIYQTDDDISTEEAGGSTRRNTVIVSDAQRSQSGLIQQINPPQYLGAIVVCQGADDPSVRLAIVEAVSKVTGLGANRISVLKMK